MHARGYSLVEMVVVIAIVSILLTLGTLSFNEYARRYAAEAQTRMIYSELLKARANALYQRRQTRVKLYEKRFEVYSSTIDSVAPIVNQALSYPITWSQVGNKVTFDSNGITTNKTSICLETDTGSVESVVIHSVRTGIGKKAKEDVCKSENITIK